MQIHGRWGLARATRHWLPRVVATSILAVAAHQAAAADWPDHERLTRDRVHVAHPRHRAPALPRPKSVDLDLSASISKRPERGGSSLRERPAAITRSVSRSCRAPGRGPLRQLGVRDVLLDTARGASWSAPIVGRMIDGDCRATRSGCSERGRCSDENSQWDSRANLASASLAARSAGRLLRGDLLEHLRARLVGANCARRVEATICRAPTSRLFDFDGQIHRHDHGRNRQRRSPGRLTPRCRGLDGANTRRTQAGGLSR
jgi:hypothetical protein